MSDVTKTGIHQGIIALLLLILGVMAYEFIVAGSTETTGERRVAVILEPGERALMLQEVRDFASRDNASAIA